VALGIAWRGFVRPITWNERLGKFGSWISVGERGLWDEEKLRKLFVYHSEKGFGFWVLKRVKINQKWIGE
jgi:hypothetical protein